MQNFLLYLQILLSALVTFLILIQARGKGLGSSFGGLSGSSFTRRGVEKWLFKATFVVIFFFIVTSIAELLI